MNEPLCDPWDVEAPGLGHVTDLYGPALTDAERRAWRRELREAAARKIPLGFPIPAAAGTGGKAE